MRPEQADGFLRATCLTFLFHDQLHPVKNEILFLLFLLSTIGARTRAKAGLKVERVKGITVRCDGVVVEFSADMLAEERVLLKLKANQTLAPASELVNSMRICQYH